MDAVRFLKQAQVLQEKKKTKLAELEMLRINASAVAGIRYDTDRVQTSPSANRMINDVIRIEEKEREICDIVKRYDEAISVISDAICRIDNADYIRLLRLRYIKFDDYDTWEKIADEMGFTDRHIYRMHGEALQLFRAVNKMS